MPADFTNHVTDLFEGCATAPQFFRNGDLEKLVLAQQVVVFGYKLVVGVVFTGVGG
jgi:hypothetical protein